LKPFTAKKKKGGSGDMGHPFDCDNFWTSLQKVKLDIYRVVGAIPKEGKAILTLPLGYEYHGMYLIH